MARQLDNHQGKLKTFTVVKPTTNREQLRLQLPQQSWPSGYHKMNWDIYMLVWNPKNKMPFSLI